MTGGASSHGRSIRPLWLLLSAALTAAIVLLLLARSTTAVQVVDQTGRPVRGATVEPVWLSVNGKESRTDDEGRARLQDQWSVFGAPKWVCISTEEGSWQVDYPPPEVIRLDPAKAVAK